MQSFYEFFLKIESQIKLVKKERWFVFDKTSMNEIKIFVKLKEPYMLSKGQFFSAVRSMPGRYFITDKGNVDFFEKEIFVRIDQEEVLSIYFEEDDAIKASELSFKGFTDPEGENFNTKYADRLDDIGLPHK